VQAAASRLAIGRRTPIACCPPCARSQLGAQAGGVGTLHAEQLHGHAVHGEQAAGHHTVLGHSYGTTVIGVTAEDTIAADDLILIASPGVGPDKASDLHLTGQNDPIPIIAVSPLTSRSPTQKNTSSTASTRPIPASAPAVAATASLAEPADTDRRIRGSHPAERTVPEIPTCSSACPETRSMLRRARWLIDELSTRGRRQRSSSLVEAAVTIRRPVSCSSNMIVPPLRGRMPARGTSDRSW